ncbi:hypothetical protein LTR86_004077 [Recurvomyces mirabilis]|nr:hypothetical protein LTR86_004077 [Recurvomyces mirabilis]
MRFFKRSAGPADDISPVDNTVSGYENEKTADFLHAENASTTGPSHKWKVSKSGDGDAAMALFSSPDEIHEPVDPVEEKRVVRKIDLMILPYLAVCYRMQLKSTETQADSTKAFFYIDKTTLSYAAIFGIRDDLKLVGTEYNWLSSIFYFGFLAWVSSCGMQRRWLAHTNRTHPIGDSDKSFDAALACWTIPVGYFTMLRGRLKS